MNCTQVFNRIATDLRVCYYVVKCMYDKGGWLKAKGVGMDTIKILPVKGKAVR